mmetsp:Transcript_27340/g.88282  ORF Transcript_27340/g.88282 Transcript_27340/m.88282 type:complete len:350 (+) Transcript_27340:347-1396(+)
MEANGLQLLRVGASVMGGPEFEKVSHVYFQPHASEIQGRMRLSCTLLVSAGTTTVMRMDGEEPRIYKEGECFWFDESFTHEVDFSATGPETLRVVVYWDALHPGYYARPHEVEASEEGAGRLRTWQRLLSGAWEPPSAPSGVSGGGDPWRTPTNSHHVEVPPPRKWVALATELDGDERVDTCSLQDQGELFHRVAFERDGDSLQAAVLLQVIRRLQAVGRDMDPGPHQAWKRKWSKALQEVDAAQLESLTENLFECIALGCSGCKAMHLSALCIEELPEEMRPDMLFSFLFMMRIPMRLVKAWCAIMELPVPPPFGWGLSEHELGLRVREKYPEILEFYKMVDNSMTQR